MSIKESITKELIFEHFNHKTSPIQRKMIYDWLLIKQGLFLKRLQVEGFIGLSLPVCFY